MELLDFSKLWIKAGNKKTTTRYVRSTDLIGTW